jgi:hypothetical protein
MSICGSSCSISVDGNVAADAHSFVINWSTAEQDVRAFGSTGQFGEWLACASNGTLSIESYDLIAGVEPGTSGIQYSANCGSATLSGNCVATTLNIAVDAKGLVGYSHAFRLTGDVSMA